MFNVGGGEVLVIALIALIVLGPQRLPDAARQVGKAMGELRRLSSGFQNELKTAFDETEHQRPTAPPRDVLAAGFDETTAAADPAPAPGANGAEPQGGATHRPRRRAPLKADPVPDRPPPRTKGS
jgi:sec-independent protein translocase protein TatB